MSERDQECSFFPTLVDLGGVLIWVVLCPKVTHFTLV
jgi:hypothetical protein